VFESFLSLLSKTSEETQKAIIDVWEGIWNGGLLDDAQESSDINWNVSIETVEWDRLSALLYLNNNRPNEASAPSIEGLVLIGLFALCSHSSI